MTFWCNLEAIQIIDIIILDIKAYKWYALNSVRRIPVTMVFQALNIKALHEKMSFLSKIDIGLVFRFEC